MSENNTTIMRNEIYNVITDAMKKYKISESEMYLILQSVQLKILDMAYTRLNYLDEELSEKVKQLSEEVYKDEKIPNSQD